MKMKWEYDKTVGLLDIEMTEEEIRACVREVEFQDKQGTIEWKEVPNPTGPDCCEDGDGKTLWVGRLDVVLDDGECYDDPPKYRYWWAERTGVRECIELIVCRKCGVLTIAGE